LRDLVERFGARGARAIWPQSRVFGRISGASWGVMVHKHLDHHLRQFGVWPAHHQTWAPSGKGRVRCAGSSSASLPSSWITWVLLSKMHARVSAQP